MKLELAIGRKLCNTHNLWSCEGEVVGKEIKQCCSLAVDHVTRHD